MHIENQPNHGKPWDTDIVRAHLVGEYPNTRLVCFRRNPFNPDTRTTGIVHRIWDETFRDAQGRRWPPRKAAGDILMLAEGG